jgi:hypothetical protein
MTFGFVTWGFAASSAWSVMPNFAAIALIVSPLWTV